MTLQEATLHTNKIGLHWIELEQTLEVVIYWRGAACETLLLDFVSARRRNLTESCISAPCGVTTCHSQRGRGLCWKLWIHCEIDCAS